MGDQVGGDAATWSPGAGSSDAGEVYCVMLLTSSVRRRGCCRSRIHSNGSFSSPANQELSVVWTCTSSLLASPNPGSGTLLLSCRHGSCVFDNHWMLVCGGLNHGWFTDYVLCGKPLRFGYAVPESEARLPHGVLLSNLFLRSGVVQALMYWECIWDH